VKTPLLEQYLAVRAAWPGKILLYQVGDFFETFFDDATTVSKVLGLALTSRETDRETGQPVPLAGFPLGALDSYLPRLLKAGFRVVVCRQAEEAARGRLVRREVTEVVTPGTIVDGPALGEHETALLASVCVRGETAAAAFCNLSTGVLDATELPASRLSEEVARRAPRELLHEEDPSFPIPPGPSLTPLERWRFLPSTVREVAGRRLGLATLAGLGLEDREALGGAVGALLSYIEDVKRDLSSTLGFAGVYRLEDHLLLDRSSALALDITETAGPDRSAVLADALDRTGTPQGARLWREWLLAPPAAAAEIRSRHDSVAELIDCGSLERIRTILASCCDLPRQTGRLLPLRAGPRDLAAVASTARQLPTLVEVLDRIQTPMLAACRAMDQLQDIERRISATLSQPPPFKPGGGDAIASGVSQELDGLRELRSGGKAWMSAMEASAREETGIQRLSIGYNRIFGYYIEVPRSAVDAVPATYSRKQTLVGAERFVTPELKEMESRILRADEDISRIEKTIFQSLLEEVAGESARIRETGRLLAVLDVLCSMAAISSERCYARPSIVAGDCLEIEDGRHPVLDILLPSGECVPNPVRLDESRRILIVTGPNMAGKSTFLRMAAQSLILAQAGCFVPARSMRFSPADRIFTRLGTGDRIVRGQSTFLLEMADAALILNASTPASRAFIDEVGRGTSTYDGLSLAWAIVEYIASHQVHRPLTLFATHYHELTTLGNNLPFAANVSVTVREKGGRVVFLYRVAEGGADRSYGIHVASMAGVPGEVIARAARVLHDLEKGAKASPTGRGDQLDLPLEPESSALRDALEAIDPDTLSPRQALDLLYELRRTAGIDDRGSPRQGAPGRDK